MPSAGEYSSCCPCKGSTSNNPSANNPSGGGNTNNRGDGTSTGTSNTNYGYLSEHNLTDTDHVSSLDLNTPAQGSGGGAVTQQYQSEPAPKTGR